MTDSAALDFELYTCFALLLRDFVHPWYKLMTTDDDLTNEILDILIVLAQKCEKRCKETDWTELTLCDIPKLLTMHFQDFQLAKTRLHMDHGSGSDSLSSLFHGIQPHFALQSSYSGKTNSGSQERQYLAVLTESMLRILLRPKDYKSSCLRQLLRDIISNLVLYNMIEVLADPYTIHTIICKLLGSHEQTLDKLEADGQFAETYFSAFTRGQMPPSVGNNNLSSKNKAVEVERQEYTESLAEQMQRLQEEYRKKRHDESSISPSSEDSTDLLDGQRSKDVASKRSFSLRYITLQVILAPLRSFWIYILGLVTQSQEQYQKVNRHEKRTRRTGLCEPTMEFMYTAFHIQYRPAIHWIWQMLAMFIWPLVRVFGGSLLLDKFLEQTILHILSENHIVFYLRAGRELLWPNGSFMQKSDAPTPLQREQMRVRAERLLTVSIPAKLLTIIFETNDFNELQNHMHHTLEALQYKQINKHLLYLLVDLILSKIFPELTNDVLV
ncbi:PXA domain-containing protein [Mycotypha africana]|uniref:PXA domain-containing protein n=1 Tax=Mycotypha africana TaxID=64632 RepID=UPI002300E366|nr:PXA domain-containing protein [Mycotypha africana]KAI8984180.1 PXA domain-containing protein [Mycotypha africana]